MKKNDKNILTSILLGVAGVCVACGFVFMGAFQKAEKVHASQVLDSFMIEETAAVRRSEPNGIRFTTNLDETTRNNVQKLRDGGYTVSYGTLMLPEDMLEGELTFETANVLNVPQSKWQEEGLRYTSVLAGTKNQDGTYNNLPESYYNRVIVARGYVKCEDKNGNTVTYYTANTAERSIGYVAVMASLIPNSQTGEVDTSDLIAEIASKTNIEAVLPETLSVNSSEKGGLIYNTIENTASALKVGGIVVPDEIIEKLGDNYTVNYRANTGLEQVGKKLQANAAGSYNVVTQITLGGKTVNATLAVKVTDSFVGTSDYKILISQNATQKEADAAKKLQNLLWESTGATLPIQQENGYETTVGKYISVGETAFAENVTVSSDKETASKIQKVGNVLCLRGNTDTGTLYGAQRLLNTLVGYEYYQENTYAVNPAQAIAMPEDTEFEPAIEYAFLQADGKAQDGYLMEQYGENVLPLGGKIAHNSLLVFSDGVGKDTSYVSATAEWKEWYATYKSGIYQKYGTNSSNQGKVELCYTAHGNSTSFENMVAKLAQEVIAALNAEKAAGGTRNRVGFSIGDAGSQGWCQCSACKNGGNASDNVVYFLNAVCAKVAETYKDDFKIVTLAYHQTNVAPTKQTPNAHIEIWFAESWADYTVGIANKDNGTKDVYTNFQNWVNLVGNNNNNDILWWTYYTNVMNFFTPYNNLTAIRENYVLAAGSGIDYFFNQTVNNRSAWTRLKQFMMSKLAWDANPDDATWDGWFDSYFANAYGPAATQMESLYNVMMGSNAANYQPDELSGSAAGIRQVFDESDYSKSTLNNWISLANNALSALDVSDPNYEVYYNNIMLEKLAPMFLLIHFHNDGTYAEEFGKYANLWEVGAYGEGKALGDKDEHLNDRERYNAVKADIGNASAAKYIEKDGAVVLQDSKFTEGSTWTLNGTTYTVSGNGALSVNLSGYATGKHVLTLINTAANKTVTFNNVWVANGKHLVTANVDERYLFNGDLTVANGETYTFTVNNTYVAYDKVAVVANGEILSPKNGVYSVENVTSDLNIGIVELSHRTSQMIENSYDNANTVVAYDEANNKYTLTDSVFNADGVNRIHGNAYIDGGYLAYMYAMGAKQISFKMTVDGDIAKQAYVNYNGRNVASIILDATNSQNSKAFTIDLVPNANADMNFWVQDANGSGNNINGKGGYIVIENLSFAIAVDKPESAWFTVSGADTVEPSEDYTFTVTPKVAGMEEVDVYVNGQKVTLTNNSYTVKNVQSTVDIDLVHGYIEQGSVYGTVSYDKANNSYALIDATQKDHGTHISAAYISKMRANGYTHVSFRMQSNHAQITWLNYAYGGTTKTNNTTELDVRIELTEDADLKLWAMTDHAESGGATGQGIAKGASFTVSNLTWMKAVEASEEAYADTSAGKLILESAYFVNGDTYNYNGVEYTVANGQLVITDLSAFTTVGTTYEVLLVGEDKLVSFDVLAVTKAIRTTDELAKLCYNTDASVRQTLTGYYVLANDLDFTGYGTVQPGGNYNQCHIFSGVFDGRNNTVSNITVGQCGIFGLLQKATVKNVNFTGVSVTNAQYAALLAGKVYEATKIQNVTAQFVSANLNTATSHEVGLMVSRSTGVGTSVVSNYVVYENVIVDASGLDVYCVFGSELRLDTTTFTNVTVKADTITKLADSAYGASKTVQTMIKEIEGVTYVGEILCQHEYDDDCDTTCNQCDEVRVAPHTAGQWSVEDGKDVYACACGEIRQELITELTERQRLVLNWAGTDKDTVVPGGNNVTGGKTNTLSIDLSGIGDWDITSATFDSTSTTGINALSFRGSNIAPKEYGNLTYTVTVTLADGSTHSVKVPVLVVTQVLTTKFDLDHLYILSSVANNGGYFELGNDIEYNDTWIHWATWGNVAGYAAKFGWGTTKAFKGTFDGCGYTIDGLDMAIERGGFITLLNGGTIKNLGFTNAKLSGKSSGFLTAWGNGTIENVYVQYAAASFGAEWWGATFFGANDAKDLTDTLTIKDCFVDASAVTGPGINASNNNSSTSVAWIGFGQSGKNYVDLQGVYAMTAPSLTQLVVNEQTGAGEKAKGFADAEAMSADSNTQAELATWNTKYWTIVNGVPVWGAYTAVTVSDEMYAETSAGNTAILYNENFVVGESYSLSGAATGTATVATAGQLTVTLTEVTEESTYQVTAETDGKIIVFTNVFGATKAIRTPDELVAIARVDSGETKGTVTGYYVLANDLDFANYGNVANMYNASHTFSGTLDGRNKVVKSITMGGGSIFGITQNATIKNINFTDVRITKNSYSALLVGQMYQGTKVQNVTAKFSEVNMSTTAAVDAGLMVSRYTGNAAANKASYENVVIDASGLDVICVFGSECRTVATTFTNVTVYAKSIGKLGDSAAGNNKSSVTGSETSTEIHSISGVKVYTVESAGNYYTFAPITETTFKLNATYAGLDDFVVYADGALITPDANGVYTIASTVTALKVVHGYIERREPPRTKVQYNDDGTILLTNAAYDQNATNGRAHGDAYISAEYIEYMISQGYTKVSFTIEADGEIATRAIVSYNGAIKVYHITGGAKACTIDLVQNSNTELFFWSQNDAGSSSAIATAGGTLTITGLTFSK